VSVAVNEARHDRHAARINGLRALRAGGAGGHGHDFPAPNDNRSSFDHLAVAHDDMSVCNDEILRRDSAEADQLYDQRKDESGKPPFHIVYPQ
jgi:hypothetical protein